MTIPVSWLDYAASPYKYVEHRGVEGCRTTYGGMSIRRTILTSGGLASAIGVCLAILSAGTLVVFSAVAARVGLGDLSNDASVASPRTATKSPPAAITFPSTQEPTGETERTAATSNGPLLDIIGSAFDASTSSDVLVGSATPNASGDSNVVGSEQVGALVSDIDAEGRNLLSRRGRRSVSRPKLPGGHARSGDEEDEPKDEKGDDRVAGRKDDEDESDHGDDDDDDDDGDSSGSRHGSRNGNRSGSRGGSGDGSRDGHHATHVRVKVAKAKAPARGHSKDAVVGGHSHHRDHDDESDSSND
jgi:hypothetical protein